MKKALFLLLLLPLFLYTWINTSLFHEGRVAKLIVVENNHGQLCNQLWHFAHLAALCKERGYALYNPPFFHYAHHFAHFQKDLLISPTNPLKMPFPLPIEAQRQVARFLKRGLKKASHREFIFSKGAYPTLPSLEGNHYCYDWHIHTDLDKERDYLLELFKPTSSIAKRIESFWKGIDRFTVGVHIRHKDYRYWRGGECFFTLAEVKANMEKVAEEYADKHPLFIIYSDEEQREEEFAPFEVKISRGSAVEDLYSMARCDLILGVEESTFNSWAAWYGGVPRRFLSRLPSTSQLK